MASAFVVLPRGGLGQVEGEGGKQAEEGESEQEGEVGAPGAWGLRPRELASAARGRLPT
jgi:hypothetical protein